MTDRIDNKYYTVDDFNKSLFTLNMILAQRALPSMCWREEFGCLWAQNPCHNVDECNKKFSKVDVQVDQKS